MPYVLQLPRVQTGRERAETRSIAVFWRELLCWSLSEVAQVPEQDRTLAWGGLDELRASPTRSEMTSPRGSVLVAAASRVPPREGQFPSSSYPRTKPASPSAAPAHGQRFPSFVGSPVLWGLFQPHTWEGAAGFGSPPRGGTAKDVSSLAARASVVALGEEVLAWPPLPCSRGAGLPPREGGGGRGPSGPVPSPSCHVVHRGQRRVGTTGAEPV